MAQHNSVGYRFMMLLAGALLAGGCASTPVLYPNRAYQERGTAAARAQVDTCKTLADAHNIRPGYVSRMVRQTLISAAVGGAGGVVAGLFSGRVRRTGAIGTAAGAGRGFVQGFNAVQQGPQPNYRRFVEQCLRSSGYQPVGWR